MGATIVTMPIGYKWLLTFAMVIGRVEIVSIAAAIVGLPILPMVKRLGGILKKAIRR
jgi:Trk-type K+ transport system membrane component